MSTEFAIPCRKARRTQFRLLQFVRARIRQLLLYLFGAVHIILTRHRIELM